MGGGDERHEVDLLAPDAASLEDLDGVGGGVARCDHRVDDDVVAVGSVGQAHEVFDGFVLGVAVDADVTDAGGGKQGEEAVGHAEAGAQDWNDDGILFDEHGRLGRADRGFDVLELRREVAGDFVAHQERDFMEQSAEVLRAGVFVAHQGELVLDEGMVDDVKTGKAGIGTHEMLPQSCWPPSGRTGRGRSVGRAGALREALRQN